MVYRTNFHMKSGHRYYIWVTCSAFPGNITVVHNGFIINQLSVVDGNPMLVQSEGYVATAEDTPLIVYTKHNTSVSVRFAIAQPNQHIFDDNKRKTISFSEKNNRWETQYTYFPEQYINVGTNLITFKNGMAYKHDAGDINKFYNKYHPSIICANHNEPQDIVKTYTHVSVEGTVAPTYFHLRTESPFVQSSDTYKSEFIRKEGVYNAPIKRDRLTPSNSGYELNLLKGDLMRGQIAKLHLEFGETNKIKLNKFDLGYNISKGLNKGY
jgi:hypothetical protein